MTVASAQNTYRNSMELYAPDRAFDPQASSAQNNGGTKNVARFETTAPERTTDAQMQNTPYELHLQGEQPRLTLYRPPQTPELNPQAKPLPGTPENVPDAKDTSAAPKDGEGAKTMEEINEETSCPVCENRKYQDGSNDPGVSMKFATKLNSYSATAAVRAHEYQHVRHHQMEAQEKDRKIISQTVMLRVRRCPHCGKMYTAGGVTKTVTAAYSDCAQKDAQPAQGQKLDACV